MKGGDIMQVEKTAEGEYLKAEFVKANKITELKLDDAKSMKYVTFPGKDGKPDQIKLQGTIIYSGQGKEDPNTWTMNNKCKNALVDAWGEDTDEWINKPIPITIGGEGTMTHILVDSLRIK